MNTKSFDPDVQDGAGWTPLMIACSLKDNTGESIVDLLLQKGADANAQTFNGQTALHFATSKGNLDIVRKLVEHKASARTKDKRSQLALHRAAAVGSITILKLLLKNRSPVNATDVDGMTALHHAIAEGHGQVALELLKAGAETEKENADGKRAIDLAPDSKVPSYPHISNDGNSNSSSRCEISCCKKQRRKVLACRVNPNVLKSYCQSSLDAAIERTKK